MPLNFTNLRLAYDQNDSMPLIRQLPRANSLLMDAETLLITHIHQPIVAPPAIRVDDAIEATGPRSRPVAASWRHPGRSPCRPFPAVLGFRRRLFYPQSTPLFSPNMAGAKRGFIPFNLAGKGDEASQSWAILARSLKNR